nr:hypothetical protein [Tanacetum cinerariifolium]
MTMATTIEKQVALDEALVPSTQRCPFFKAFLVTADVPEIYMQELWATVYVHQRSIRFKMNNKKHIVDLESFREMLHICPRFPGQAFAELPFEEEILEFIWFLGHGATIKTLTDVVSRHQNTQQYGAMLPIELTNDEIRNTKAYKEYYAFATGETAPKPKAIARRKMSGSDTSITPPTATTTPTTTVAVSPKLTAAAKSKQLAKAKSLSFPSAVARTEAQQLKIVLRRSRQQTHISQLGGFGTDERTGLKPGDDDEGDEGNNSKEGEEDDDDDEEKNGDERDDDDQDQEVAKHDDKEDTEESGNVDEEGESDEEDDNEETRDEESFDPIPQTLESSKDEEELYRDVNMNQGKGIQATLDVQDSHVTLTPVHPDGQQESSFVSSHFVTSMLNPPSDAGMESIFATASSSVAPLQTSTPIMTSSTIATITTICYAPIPPTIIPSEVLQNLPTLDSVFHFEDRLKIIKEQVKGQVEEQVSRILPRIKQHVNAQLEATVLTRSTHSSRTSYAVAADLSEMELKKILIEKMEGNKSIQHSDEQRNLYKALVDAYEADKTILDSYRETVILKRRRDDDDDQDEGPSVGSARGSKRRREGVGQRVCFCRGTCADYLSDERTLISGVRNRVDTLTPELLVGPTYELMKGSFTILIELEYHLEEVYKATTDQLDWVNPEGQQYPHNLLQPLPLIPDNRGHRVIPFAHYINNDLEYLRGGAFSRKYITSVTKTRAADYGNIKWIKDLVPRTMWIQEPIDYEKNALWGVSHWGRKHQQFYGFAVNRESALDVYSKRRIIAIYKFKEGDFKRLRLQDVEDMLLLLVQGKLSNMIVEERFAFNVSLRMFTRSIVIQRRVEDLQLGVKSYQKRLNLTKPDTCRSDLKRREAYTAYSNPRGFIYQNKDKKNRLMWIDKLHKFSDGTLNDVRTTLDDRLKGVRMQYLPQTIWRKGDKDRAAAMIQAIDKMLKTRRIMRSLEKFVGGRLYEEDFRMLQRTI